MSIARLKPATLLTLYRIAKHPTKGTWPFFEDPKAIIALRAEVEKHEVS